MKKLLSYILIVLLVAGSFGCVRRTTSTGPENPGFKVVIEDQETAAILAYFQAHPGYLPTIVRLDDETLAAYAEELEVAGDPKTSKEVLESVVDGATCLLLKSDSWISSFEELGLFVDNENLKNLTASYRIDNADLLGLTVVQMPEGSEVNLDALKALASWITGAEAKLLKDNPDLLK